MSIVDVRMEGDGVAVVAVNNPPVNTIDAKVRAGLFDALGRLAGARAVLLVCEGGTFFSGADIGEFSGPPKEEEYRRLFNAIEALPVPVVAAMHGTVMGGGVEIALACHYRIAAAGTRFAMPEVTLGIIPGAGGTQRMPRLVGVERALELIVSAAPIDAAKAAEIGYLDRVADGDLRAAALAYVRELLAAGKGPRRTGEMTVDPATGTDEILARFAEQAAKQYRGRRAPLTAIEAVRASMTKPLAQGLEYETELVNGAKATTESRGAVHVFFAERETRRVPGLEGVAARPVKRAAIVGAGTMGGGIAICFANAGIPVTLLDATREALDRGLKVVDATYQSQVERGRLAPDAKAARMALISGSLDYADARDADLWIEAVFEDMALKRRVFADIERAARPGAVLATNTSTLDIDAIASTVQRRADVIGLHFFSPANVMPLLEVVRTKDTAPDVIRTAMELSRPLRKTPVLASVCYGFIGNRMMEGYAREAERIVLEGATPRQVDTALENWGMAMGILAVFDMAGIAVGVNVHRANADKFPPDPAYYQADFALHEAGREGQKNGKGYYRYEGRKRLDDPLAVEILRARARALGVPQREHTEQEIVERCLFPMVNEGLRILEEGVALRASDIDVVWCAGYGFPRWRGGPMFFGDTVGAKTVLEGMRKYAAQQGEPFGPVHWAPSKLLERLAAEGGKIADWRP